MKTLISLTDLPELAKDFAFLHAKAGNTVLLYGDLGAGKTSFAREVIKAIIPDVGSIQSPTFNLLQIYNAEEFQIYHFDLYRLKSAAELEELGVDEALATGFCLIEWPELVENLKPQNKLIKVKIAFAEQDDKREFSILNS